MPPCGLGPVRRRTRRQRRAPGLPEAGRCRGLCCGCVRAEAQRRAFGGLRRCERSTGNSGLPYRPGPRDPAAPPASRPPALPCLALALQRGSARPGGGRAPGRLCSRRARQGSGTAGGGPAHCLPAGSRSLRPGSHRQRREPAAFALQKARARSALPPARPCRAAATPLRCLGTVPPRPAPAALVQPGPAPPPMGGAFRLPSGAAVRQHGGECGRGVRAPRPARRVPLWGRGSRRGVCGGVRLGAAWGPRALRAGPAASWRRWLGSPRSPQRSRGRPASQRGSAVCGAAGERSRGAGLPSEGWWWGHSRL